MGKQDLRMRLENCLDVLLQLILSEIRVQKDSVDAKLGVKVIVRNAYVKIASFSFTVSEAENPTIKSPERTFP